MSIRTQILAASLWKLMILLIYLVWADRVYLIRSVSKISLKSHISKEKLYFKSNRALLSMKNVLRNLVQMNLPPSQWDINLNHSQALTQVLIKAETTKLFPNKLKNPRKDKTTTIMHTNFLRHSSMKHAKIVASWKTSKRL
jgi:hypothetical protein